MFWIRLDGGVDVAFMRDTQRDQPYVRAFDADGAPRNSAVPVTPVVGGSEVPTMFATGLAAAGGGHARLLTSISTIAQTSEIALVDLDATGTSTGTSVDAGTPDGDTVSTLALASLADGSTLVGWDRIYNACHGDMRPSRTMTGVVDSAWNLGPLTSVGDAADQQYMAPSLASIDGTAYVEWTAMSGDASTMWLAMYPAFDGAVAIGPAWQTPAIALTDAQHGALAWIDADSNVDLQRFDNTAGIVLGELRTILPVDTDPEVYKSLAGVAPVGDGRFLIAWEEQPQDWTQTRLYATVVDFAEPAPAMPAKRTSPIRAFRRPCI